MNSISLLLGRLLSEKQRQVWLWAAIVAITGAVALMLDFSDRETATSALEPEDPETAATHIPAGFVLVPIEVANYESLDSILGKFGVVDLYSAPLDPNQRPKKVATRMKILRAPLNPNHFAVLALDSDSEKLLSFQGPFTVVVQNPSESGTGFVNHSSSGPKESLERHRKPGMKERAPSRITIEVEHADETEN